MPETAAVYWESKIRIYGFQKKCGLTMLSLDFPHEDFKDVAGLLDVLSRKNGSFDLVLLHRIDEKRLQFCCVLPKENAESCLGSMREAIKKRADISLALDFPVEMLSFHGPHFQDRYGIAHGAFSILEENGIPVHVAGCAGTSICVVVPETYADNAIRRLKEAFLVPESVEKKQVTR